ncbi:hypothetical protein [Halomonas sp. PR-M31]|nr:hypothetical protein [Halomonas sp. PR-M31]
MINSLCCTIGVNGRRLSHISITSLIEFTATNNIDQPHVFCYQEVS